MWHHKTRAAIMKNFQHNSTQLQFLDLQNLSIQNWQNSATVVDKQDQVLGAMDKYLAHKYPPVLHRAISIWLFNEKGEVLLQQRSSKKKVSPLKWGNAVCGNVRYGETRLTCAYRRLYQELGIGKDLGWDKFEVDDKNRRDQFGAGKKGSSGKFQNKKLKKIDLSIKKSQMQCADLKNIDLKPIFKFSYCASADNNYFEYEIDQVYVAEVDADLKMNLNPAEVETVQWVNAKEFQAQLAKLAKQDPQKSLIASKKQLKQNFSAQIITINSQKFEIAPWTVMMGQDERM